MMESPSTDSEEKREPVSDIDTAPMEGLKALDPKRPIREADMQHAGIGDQPCARSHEVPQASGQTDLIASMGSDLDARNAGYQPKNTPTGADDVTARETDQGSTINDQLARREIM